MINGNNILTIGIQYKPIKGGVAAVISEYSKIIQPFNFIATVNASNKFLKFLVLLKAIVLFLYYMLFKRNIKIIHIHGASYASFWRKSVFIIIGKLFRKKIIYHIHGAEFALFSQKHSRSVQFILSKCDCIIALSESWKKFFEDNFNCNNVVIIKNIIEEPIIHPISHEKFTLLFLGRIGERKGFYDLLEVIQKNRDLYKNKLLLLFGGDGEVDNVQKLIRQNNISDIIQYQGWVSGEKKKQLLNMADAYILPSYNEGLPISVLEAMSYSLPIISTNVGGIPEIVKNGINGFIVLPGYIYGIEFAINKLLNDVKLCKQMGKKSSKMVEEHLPKYVSKQLYNLYTSIIK